uniref:Eukaryotic elongation factor-2 kinase n=1 Tax=Hirondellea gigas TaxID=1518452 RepID=A0A6A7FU59_9CRUS
MYRSLSADLEGAPPPKKNDSQLKSRTFSPSGQPPIQLSALSNEIQERRTLLRNLKTGEKCSSLSPNQCASTCFPIGQQHARKVNRCLEKLKNLTQLRKMEMITEVDFLDRKRQLLDELTGISTSSKKTDVSPAKIEEKCVFFQSPEMYIAVVEPNQPPPDFSTIASENAIKHVFNSESGTWSNTKIVVKMTKKPFDRGTLRLAYYMCECDVSENEDQIDQWDNVCAGRILVAKISIDPFEEKDSYFHDVAMQAFAQQSADMYNQYDPPKPVAFIRSWVLQLVDRNRDVFCGVEEFIDGSYRKHNNNYGFVDDDERSTPQAFSHFTYEVSQRKLLICDIQGVNDLYTDPQMHSLDGCGFGKGNMGRKGIEKFLATHRCNAICRYLKLAAVNAKPDFSGTRPSSRLMSYRQVDVLTSVSDAFQNPMQAVDPLPPLKKKVNRRQHEQPKLVSHRRFLGRSRLCCSIL